jgi:hypothetical protein
MTDFPESKLEWLVKTFGEYDGWFNATDIARRGENSYIASDWKRLMKLAIDSGIVSSSDWYWKARKNSIAFNLPVVSEYFDPSIFYDHNFRYAPYAIFSIMDWDMDSTEFLNFSAEWDMVYKILICYQYSLVPDAPNLIEPIPLPPELYGYCKRKAHKLAIIYKLIKCGWNELIDKELKYPQCNVIDFGNHNDLFIQIVWANFHRRYLKSKNRGKPLSPSYKLKLAQEIHYTNDISTPAAFDENYNRLLKFMGGADYELGIPPEVTFFASCQEIKDFLKGSSDPLVIGALKELEQFYEAERTLFLKRQRKISKKCQD